MSLDVASAEFSAGHPVSRVPAPAQRLWMDRALPAFARAMADLEKEAAAALPPQLARLLAMHVAGLSRCTANLVRLAADAVHSGEEPERVIALPVWRGTSLFTAQERAALTLCEAVAEPTDLGVADEVWEMAALELDAWELAGVVACTLTAVATSRLAIATRTLPETGAGKR